MLAMLQPVSRSTLSDSIIEQIKKLILDGHLKPGERLPSERELGEQLSVGRTSVREALKALSTLGMIRRTTEGTFVNQEVPSIHEHLSEILLYQKTTITEIFETRHLFEIGLAGLAAQRATDEDIKAMENALTIDKRTDDVKSFIESDRAFHIAIAEAAQNMVLYEMFMTIQHLLFHSHDFYRNKSSKQESVTVLMNTARLDHDRIFEAIITQNVELAQKSMERHLDNIKEILINLP
jgi:GntR family transcriptional repressor for pyruvate dehydrogenase complex